MSRSVILQVQLNLTTKVTNFIIYLVQSKGVKAILSNKTTPMRLLNKVCMVVLHISENQKYKFTSKYVSLTVIGIS